jgi:hypothetical protein
MFFACLTLVLRPTCHAQVAGVLFRKQVTSEMASFTVIVPEQNFKPETLVKLSGEYLSRYPNVKLLQVGFYPDKQMAADSLGKTVYHVSYDTWKEEYRRRLESKLRPAATFLKYDECSTLRIRKHDGEVSEIHVSGQSSFRPVVDDIPLNLVYVSFAEQGFGNSSRLTPHFYLVLPKRVSTAEAASLAKALFNKIGVSDGSLHLREDEWFIFDPFYP